MFVLIMMRAMRGGGKCRYGFNNLLRTSGSYGRICPSHSCIIIILSHVSRSPLLFHFPIEFVSLPFIIKEISLLVEFRILLDIKHKILQLRLKVLGMAVGIF